MQKEIKLKIVGTGVFTTIEKKPYKVTLKTKEEKDKLKDLVEKYNKKPSEYWLNRIVKVFTPKIEVSKKKIEKKVEKKKVKEAKAKIVEQKEEVKAVDEIAQLAASATTATDLTPEAAKKIEEAAKPVEKEPVQGKRFGGETYGRHW